MHNAGLLTVSVALSSSKIISARSKRISTKNLKASKYSQISTLRLYRKIPKMRTKMTASLILARKNIAAVILTQFLSNSLMKIVLSKKGALRITIQTPMRLRGNLRSGSAKITSLNYSVDSRSCSRRPFNCFFSYPVSIKTVSSGWCCFSVSFCT